ncbi:DUF2931 family protein [Cronobacter dublinensis]|uniref:DUF2931 family protein n=1 Tax=Cronobacter dublinensis TaxID=413497 RepID=UPI0024AD4B39|nr:DUF2931 family protein [Cronobacter dublinensis]EGT4361034.1 hypothetical protein [Cronobacter dublinensis]MDI6478641.1 DUF2931 family protein [Cronobacter dublinensis]
MKLAIILIMSSVCLTGCSKSANEREIKAPFDEWYFTFTTPKALPAQVTLVKTIDVNGYGKVFRTIDQPQGQSVGRWDQHAGKGRSPFNKAKSPPRAMLFCWDSIIDKKVYETTLIFHDETWQKMLTTEASNYSPKKTYYFRFMVIGLAPEGKVRIWLKNNGRPNIEQTKTKIITVSGKELDMCKNETNFHNGYEYSESMKVFIKGKKYPYGTW